MNYIYSKYMHILSKKGTLDLHKLVNAGKVAIILFAFTFAVACTAEKKVSVTNKPLTSNEIATIDSLMFQKSWTVPDGPQRLLPVRTWDLKHQKIEVRFHFAREEVLGKTQLFFTSLKDNNDSLALDAKQLDIEAVYHPDSPSSEAIAFTQDSTHLYFKLSRTYSRGDSIFIAIKYRAKGKTLDQRRGIQFVDPNQMIPDKLTQVWASGALGGNSTWLPTIDHPAERATQETWISVPDSMETISNGRIIESRTWPGDSLTTHFWLMDKPHPPYQFSLAAGNYAISNDLDDDIVYRFYTSPKFAPYSHIVYQPAKKTGRFLQEYLQTTYPWNTFSMVPVQQLPSKGIPGTTAAFLNNHIQFDDRAARDINNTDLIVNQFAQQWFGNLVTPENWANIALSKGMASYIEVLYKRKKMGKNAADWQSLQQKIHYLNEADRIRRPVIFDRYEKPSDMLDAHSYDKMSRILRMLHHLVGDDVWRRALQLYLQEYSYESVNYRDLQEVFERQSGKNLEWFFQQWLLEPGHPTIQIEADTTNGRNHLRIIQMQDIKQQPIYRVPLDVEFTYGQKSEHNTLWVENVDSTYHLTIEPGWNDVIVDPDNMVLAEFKQRLKKEQLVKRLDHRSVTTRYQALRQLDGVTWDSEMVEKVKALASKDPWWGIRRTAMATLVAHKTPDLLPYARTRTHQTESEGRVRIHALYLVKNDTTDATREYLKTMLEDPSYFVAAEAITIFGEKYPKSSFEVLKKFGDENSYRQVIKAAFAQAMKHSQNGKATETLLEMAQAKSTDQYTLDAIKSLYMRNRTGKMGKTDTNRLLQTCYEKLGGNDAGQIDLCLSVIGDLADAAQLYELQDLLEHHNYPEAIKNRLETIINQLKPEQTTIVN